MILSCAVSSCDRHRQGEQGSSYLRLRSMQTMVSQQYTVNLGLIMAFGVVISLPVAIIFAFAQRHLI